MTAKPVENTLPKSTPDRLEEKGSFLQAMVLALVMLLLFYAYRFLVARAIPAFSPPVLVHRGQATFDTVTVKNPVLLSLAVSPKGKIGLLDSKSGVTQVFDATGHFLLQTPAEMPGAGKLKRPLGLTFGDNEEIFLADTGNQRIVQFSPDGTSKILGRAGIFNGQFVLPTAVQVYDGNLFVLDSALCRIQQFNLAGLFQTRIGRKGEAPGSFVMPTALAHDADFNLVVLDTRISAVSRFDFLLNFTQQVKISGPSKTFVPTRVAFAGDGLSFYLSKGSQEIAVFFQNMAIETFTPEKLGVPGAFWTDIAGKENILYLLDGKNQKADFFELM